MRLYLVGTSGSGKTTFAKKLAASLNLQHLELDSIHHQANWTPLPVDDFRLAVDDFTSRSDWVIDGNYGTVQDIILERCTAVVILDYSRSLVMRRVIRRTLTRMITRKTLWNGNRESWKYLFTINPDENIVLWAWSTYERRRRQFDDLERIVGSSAHIYRLTKPSQASRLLIELSSVS
jgi:adenylate kinase family enzyme